MAFYNGLVAAMEEGEVDADSDGMDSDFLPGDVEQGSQEIAEDTASLESLFISIEEAIEGADDLEDIGEVIENSEDGLSESAAEIAAVATESICNRLGIMNARLIPATESFGSTSSRKVASRIALESIKDHIVRIWEAIKKAFKEGWARVKKFIIELIGQTARMERSIKSIEDKIQAFDSHRAAKSIEFKSSYVYNAFSYAIQGSGHKINASNVNLLLARNIDIIKSAGSFNDKIEMVVKKFPDVLKKINSTGKDNDPVTIMSDINEGSNLLTDALKTIPHTLSNATSQLGSGYSAGRTNSHNAVMEFGPFANNKKIILIYREEGNVDPDDKMKSISFTIETKPYSAHAVQGGKDMVCMALDKGQMSAIVGDVKKLFSGLNNYKQTMNKHDNFTNELEKIIDTTIGIITSKKAEWEDAVKNKDWKKYNSDKTTFGGFAVPFSGSNNGEGRVKRADQKVSGDMIEDPNNTNGPKIRDSRGGDWSNTHNQLNAVKQVATGCIKSILTINHRLPDSAYVACKASLQYILESIRLNK